MRVLTFAFSCRPGWGSEPGAGWGLVSATAEFAHCTVLTAPIDHGLMTTHLEEHGPSSIEPVCIPQPELPSALRKSRVAQYIEYYGWLRRARRVAEELVQRRAYDLVHHATFSVYWLPTPATDLGLPSVWGPVGGAVTTPRELRSFLGVSGLPEEWSDLVSVSALERLPATRRSWRKSTAIIAQNEETAHRIATTGRRAHVINHALFVDFPVVAPEPAGEALLWIGAIEARKGLPLALRALAQTRPDVRMDIIGDGPLRPRAERLASRLGLEGRTRFLGRIAREEALRHVSSATACVFTGLREEGGLALGEAMRLGSPVVVLDHGGAGSIARTAVDPSRVSLIRPSQAQTTVLELAAAMEAFHDSPPRSRRSQIDTAGAKAQLYEVFQETAGSRGEEDAG